MVLLTMTASIVEVLKNRSNSVFPKELISKSYHSGTTSVSRDELDFDESMKHQLSQLEIERQKSTPTSNLEDPMLIDPKVGNPISHRQILDLYKAEKSQMKNKFSLEDLLRGSRPYTAPPAPKPEQTLEYKNLMARLRQEEEERKYKLMTNPPPPSITSFQHSSPFSATRAFPPAHLSASDENEEVTYTEVNRQITLILNVLISIVACGAAIWIAARWWSYPTRLALSMSGSILVGIAEIVVYSGYIRRVSEAKVKEKTTKEVKDIIQTWIIKPDEDVNHISDSNKPVALASKETTHETQIRRRK